MTAIEQRAIAALSGVSVGCYRVPGKGNVPADRAGLARARELFRILETNPERPLTFDEAGDLWYYCWKYRRQISDPEVIARANEVVNGALSLRFC